MAAAATAIAATSRRGAARQRAFRNPGWFVVIGFLSAVAIGTALLSLPFATASGESPHVVDAMFTATSAVTVTGLTAVDTATYWSAFGHVVILGLIQIGGLGILTSASLLFLVVARRVGLRRRLAAQMEVRSLELGGLRRLVTLIVAVTFATEAVISTVLTLRFWLGYGESFPDALWLGVFHGVSAFNNAGFALFRGSLEGFSGDALVLAPVALAVIIGGIGFPVWAELSRRPGPLARWSIHTKITLSATALLLLIGIVAITAFEWANPETIGQRSVSSKIVDGAFAGVMPRTAGFGTFDYGAIGQDTMLLSNILMVIGGGSAGVAGGLKVTTVALLALVVWAELRGDSQVVAFRRHIPDSIQRQAFTVATLLISAITIGTFILVSSTDLALGVALFECVSATTTTGLSLGTSEELDPLPKSVLIPLMLLGRIGPLTLGSALILRETQRRYSRPDERIMVV
jgi:trk system potassium uptake protein